MRIIVILLALVFVTVAEAAPSLEEERKVGEKADEFIRKEFGIVENDALQEYVSEIGHKVLQSITDPEFEFHFTVVDHDMINAFAVPGGYVYITRGMLTFLNSEAALAGVLGHEIGHVVAHHSYKKMKKSLGDTLLIFAGVGAGLATGQGGNVAAWAAATSSLSQMTQAGYGRELEEQADEFGMIYAYDAGYDPRAQSTFFKMLQFRERMGGAGYHGFMASHPDTVMRVIKTKEKANIIVSRGNPTVMERDRYLKQLQGLAYGEKNKASLVPPPHILDIYTAVEGDDFRSIARAKSEDEGMALDIATMNGMKTDDPIPPGTLLKVPVKRPPRTENALPEPLKTDQHPEKDGKEKRRGR